jgi:hypothetical protein
MISPGREHDIRMLEEMVLKAKSTQERNKWNHKIRQIREEGNHPDIMNARHKLIEATRRNDIKEIEERTDELHRLGQSKGMSK